MALYVNSKCFLPTWHLIVRMNYKYSHFYTIYVLGNSLPFFADRKLISTQKMQFIFGAIIE